MFHTSYKLYIVDSTNKAIGIIHCKKIDVKINKKVQDILYINKGIELVSEKEVHNINSISLANKAKVLKMLT